MVFVHSPGQLQTSRFPFQNIVPDDLTNFIAPCSLCARKVLVGELRSRAKNGEETLWIFTPQGRENGGLAAKTLTSAKTIPAATQADQLTAPLDLYPRVNLGKWKLDTNY